MRIQSLPTALGLIAFATLGLHITACGDNAAEGGSSEAASGAPNSATGGASAEKNTTTTKSSGKGGTSAKSSAAGRGGQKQTSEAVEEGGSSGSTDEPQNEGGTSEGGSSAKTRTSATGGATSKSSTKASGGSSSSSAKATGGSAATTTKAAGGASTATTKATGGTGSVSATGGATGNPSAEKFSFFVISYKAIIELSGTDKGFGGDLRNGETGDKAGLRGADKICTKVAESSMPNNGKTWRAFLSTSYENAIDRIGEGPWYDRRGRVFAMKKADLLSTRPTGADSAIVNDFPNENGVTNHNPDGTGDVDNHDFLTGSGVEGKIYKSTATCSDWTNAEPDTSKKPRVGHSWPRKGMSFPGMGEGDTGGSTTNVEGMEHWISALDESGCGPGQYQPTAGQFDGPPGNDGVVGSGGGYGGWYCFALTP
ncbi:MAG TPA: hypothetical protein VKP30_03010 [Polyangiaceae bacterium]|nr:hypothetical protein [Polyangiaceae bacterium]